jgi:LAS superfamily LD-carboxypeptidase LdcB
MSLMRIIEPRELEAARLRRSKRRGAWAKTAVPFVVAAAFITGLGIYSYNKPETDGRAPRSGTPARTEAISPQSAEAEQTNRVIRTFTGQEFVDFYNRFAYPNVTEVSNPPPITGDADADERIRSIAVSRGYMQRSIAIPPLEKIDGEQLQRLAVTPWVQLKAAAAKAGHRLRLGAGFRSVEDQRTLFTSRLYATGATAASIADGSSDAAVIRTLQTASIPGYTRHHTGYTVDIECESHPGVVFAASRCFAWLNENNYAHAKEFGWIPSYPDNAAQQGPEPEAWEYVWVGADALKVAS